MRDFVAEKIRMVPPSGIRRFFDIASTMADVISLGIGEPDFDTPPAIVRAGIESLETGETHYTSNSGILELRVALANHLEHLYGLRYDPETELLITVGVSEALHLALAATVEVGDEVIVPEPCFVSYNPEVIFANGEPLNDSFLDYRIPTMEDVPEIIPIIVEKENARIPEDIRGIGEPPAVPTAAAVANAVYDAVGIRLKQLPLTPERVFWRLKGEESPNSRV